MADAPAAATAPALLIAAPYMMAAEATATSSFLVWIVVRRFATHFKVGASKVNKLRNLGATTRERLVIRD